MAAPGGVLPLGDRSASGAISSRLGISKSQFKAAVGSLYKARLLAPPDDEEIRLLNADGSEGEDDGAPLQAWGDKKKDKWAAQVRVERKGGRKGGSGVQGLIGCVLTLVCADLFPW